MENKRYKCLENFSIPHLNKDGFMDEEKYFTVDKDSIWILKNNECVEASDSILVLEKEKNIEDYIEISSNVLNVYFNTIYKNKVAEYLINIFKKGMDIAYNKMMELFETFKEIYRVVRENFYKYYIELKKDVIYSYLNKKEYGIYCRTKKKRIRKKYEKIAYCRAKTEVRFKIVSK